MFQIVDLNIIISEISLVYSSKVKEIVKQTENSDNTSFNRQQLKELEHLKKQLNLLFSIRDNCYQVFKDLELLRDSYSLLK